MEEHQAYLIILYDEDSFKLFIDGKSPTVDVYLRTTTDPDKRISGAMEYAKETHRKLRHAATIKCKGFRDVADKYIKSRFAKKRFMTSGIRGNLTNIYHLDKSDLSFLMNLDENFEAEKL